PWFTKPGSEKLELNGRHAVIHVVQQLVGSHLSAIICVMTPLNVFTDEVNGTVAEQEVCPSGVHAAETLVQVRVSCSIGRVQGNERQSHRCTHTVRGSLIWTSCIQVGCALIVLSGNGGQSS